ncbi:uncharacterized protein YndB with AHSA1/START domain [Granulicella aggregans]|uniref:Uncharacterized protein YndB with AHSA1/START domain n=1 Tax=Granulicella aggregans TaxID=474949 RepID=A0A7W7ZI79_9BACT|nr:SRPBCC domain-containing protein [Granulicella aggregans]MBB5060353.1 uncharacterized protein YndB with AHSA1/START domain [Granulicella aggregans]
MNSINVIGDAIVQEVQIKASPGRIFDALTNPSELLKWWVVKERFKTTDVEVDLRPGGKWMMRVEGGCGPGTTSSIVHGEYRKIEPPHLLAFTWMRDGENAPETLVCWELHEGDTATTVRVTHSGLTSESLRLRNSGWPLIQSLLQTYLEQNL